MRTLIALTLTTVAACSPAESDVAAPYVDAAQGPSGDAAVIHSGDVGGDGQVQSDVGPVADQFAQAVDAGRDGGAADALIDGEADVHIDGSPGDAHSTPADATSEPDAATAADVGPSALDANPGVAPDAALMPVECAPEADPRPGQAREDDGRFVRFPDFNSHFVSTRRVTVRLPSGGLPPAGPSPAGLPESERLPVLYMHDGQNVFLDEEAAFGTSWGAIATLDDLAAGPGGERLLVVAVDNTARRVDDYTPVPDLDRMDGGEANAYGQFLVEELKPFIDFHFPTRCRPEDTGLMGSSLGGLVSLYLGAQYPDVFGRIAALSPSLWWADGVAFDWVAGLAVALESSPGRRLYLDAGNQEGDSAVGPGSRGRSTVIADTFDFALAVVDGLPAEAVGRVALVEDPGAAHNEPAWRRRLPNALAFTFGPALGDPSAADLWPWAPALRAGESTRLSIFAQDALGRSFTVLGPLAALESDNPVIDVDASGLVSGDAPGAAILTATSLDAAAPAPASMTVAAADESIVHLLVSVPEGSARVFVGGSLESLGPWAADSLELRPLTPILFEGFLVAPTGEPFEFKFTLGTWDAVEKNAAGADIQNRTYTPRGDAELEFSVPRFGPLQ